MIYLMSGQAYWKYINEFNMTHIELIQHLNSTLGLKDEIKVLHIRKEG